ncbi:MAG: DnaA regulatory inactivator Hda [Gammaproteobacteria bacterium]|nr:MAG: DnaA regulatory inactivator Hda [Gammaproteobacteria bacterium]
MHPQLTLPFDGAGGARLENFHVDDGNVVARDSVEALVGEALGSRQLYLWGSEGAGKSHLLVAACHAAHRAGKRVALLTAALVGEPEMLEGLEQADLVCIDDLQVLDRQAEEPLFHFINRCHERGVLLLIAAERAPEALDLSLRDLVTRLAWGPVFQLPQLGEAGLADAIRAEFSHRSLAVRDDLVAWMLKRLPRRLGLLKPLIDAVDEASLQTGRRVTIPLVREVLQDVQALEDAAAVRDA